LNSLNQSLERIFNAGMSGLGILDDNKIIILKAKPFYAT
jgi:hypothetical protein